MAKTKASTPKKGTKATAADEQTTVRRSPRKAVESAKKKEAGSASPPAKVVKRASPAKKASSPAKQSTPSKTTSKAKDSPAAMESAKAAKSVAATATPKPRGRPRKDTTATSKAHEVAGVAAHGQEDEWPDSPKKRSPSKRSIKAAPTTTSTAEDGDEYHDDDDEGDEGAREAGLAGVRKSIETSNTGKRGRGQARNTSKTPSRTATRSPTKSKARSTSVGRAASKSGARSKSPVKAAVGSAANTQEKSSAVTAKARSMSPTKSSTRQESYMVSNGPREKTPGTARRGRPPGSTKAKAAEASRTPSVNPAKSPGRPSSRRSLSTGSDAGPLLVDKTRASHSPSKTPVRTAARTRSVSPVKRAAQAPASRRSSLPAVRPGRARSKSPAKALCSPSRQAFDDNEFEKWFHDDSPYGKALRRIESSAYKHRKAGNEFEDSSDEVEADHDQRAKARGVQRAELEMSLRNGSAGHGQRPTTSNSPTKRKASKELESPRKKFTRARSPGSRQASVSANEDAALQPGQASGPHRGTVRSVTNPEFIPDTNNKKNPFFETMPAPEVWHRRMPPYLPFGETPFMEAELSKQINKDLSKGKQGAVGSEAARDRRFLWSNCVGPDFVDKLGPQQVRLAGSSVYRTMGHAGGLRCRTSEGRQSKFEHQ
ncbi:hypothetical protein LTR37_009494 [Vermiconidia calcicola]|uniref:Uncharacterized protein n=1 Tax=Vermiconidia calcicola TaxID=1690605 RepID=A0ACC3N894_9PEZI|nr:hypothetical protein LTR37_009494 [Vermiconidia calcicola]